MENPTVSIIIKTYNEEKNIGNCLNIIFNQTYRDFEVIIVDSESGDDTLKIASKFPVTIIKIKRKYCISLSAHATPLDNSWLENLIAPLEKEMIAGAYAREIPREDCNPPEMRKILGTFGNKEKIQIEDCFFSNVSSAFKKDLWKDVKFNEKIRTTEDHFWANEMIKKGYAICYQPKAKVYHSHNHSLRSLYMRLKAQLYDKYKGIENKNALYICCKGFANFAYSVIADWAFVLKRKENIYWLFAAIPYNITTLMAYISAAFKKL